MHQALALRAVQAFQKQFALTLEALLERQLDGRAHAFDDLGGREQAARLLDAFKSDGVQLGQGRGLVGNGKVARAPGRHAARQQLVHIGQAGDQRVVALGQLVHQAGGQGCLGRQVLAAEHQLGRGLHAHQARRALRAAGAGQQAQIHLGQAQFGTGQGDTEMRGHGDFEPTAQGRAVDGGDHQLGARLHAIEHIGQRGRHGRLAELADVGAGDEGLALADDEHGLERRVLLQLLHRRQQAGTHALAQGVDGRVVDADHQHRALLLGLYQCLCVHALVSPLVW